MLFAKFDQNIVVRFHNFLMGEFNNPKVLAGKDETIAIELITGGYAYHLNDQTIHLTVNDNVAEVEAFTLALYRGDCVPILVESFHFSEILFYEARNVFLNWLLFKRVDHTQTELKYKKRISNITDDKPYGEVDIVVHINSSYEVMSLYKEYKAAGWSYKQDMGCYLHTLGHHDEMPVCITPMVHEIEGVKVMYVEATSMVVDWEMIDKWVHARCKKDVVIETNPANLIGEIRRMMHKKENAQ